MTKIKRANASEAIYGFASWLTVRDATLKAGAKHDAAPMAELVGQYCEAQGFTEPRGAFPDMLKNMRQL